MQTNDARGYITNINKYRDEILELNDNGILIPDIALHILDQSGKMVAEKATRRAILNLSILYTCIVLRTYAIVYSPLTATRR